MENFAGNKSFADALVFLFGGKVHYEAHNVVIWLHNGVTSQVRCSGRNICVCKPKLFPVDNVVFLLTDYGVWGISDFSKKYLGPKDATGFFPPLEQ